MPKQSRPQSTFSKTTLTTTMSLSRLKLSAADQAALAKELPAITKFVSQLTAVSAKTLPAPEATALGERKLRSGRALLSRWPLAAPEDLVAASPVHRDGFVAVPHVFSP